jgi:hypothetical protein
MIEQNHDWRYDLKVGQEGENLISKLLRRNQDNFTVECKLDTMAHRTGNFYFEYNSRGRKSGLNTTQADFYALMTADQNFVMIVRTEKLKAALHAWKQKCIDQNLPPEQTWKKRGGDNKTSIGLLIPINELIQQILLQLR